MATWKKTDFPGVRYREHATRRYGEEPDRYFSIRYKIAGKLKEEGLGWASAGWDAQQAATLRTERMQNQRQDKELLGFKGKQGQDLDETDFSLTANNSVRKNSLTFKEAAQKFIAWGKRHKKDWPHDQSRLEHLILPMIGGMCLQDIQPAHIEQIKTACQDKGFTAANTRHYLQVVRAVFNHTRRNDLFQGSSPVQGVIFPRQDNWRRRFLTYAEADTLLRALWPRSRDVHDLALLSLHTGMRMGECFDLTWDCIDWEQEIIHVPASTNQNPRPAYMTRAVKDMLQRRRKSVDTSLVYPSRDGDRFTKLSHTFYKTVHDLGWNEGLEDQRHKVVFQTLRHTFASWLALQGESLATIQELMGLKSAEMTLRYRHLMPDHKRAAVDTLAQRAHNGLPDSGGSAGE